MCSIYLFIDPILSFPQKIRVTVLPEFPVLVCSTHQEVVAENHPSSAAW